MSKVMLVEDDNNLREIYEARLRAEGYDIVSARDGEEGLVVAKAEKPDLIIADIMMPKISGFEMLDILRNTDGLKNVRVIMLTALGQSDDQQRATSLGADRYLVKSQVTLEDIVKASHELLGDDGGQNSAAPAAPSDTPPPAGPPAPSDTPAPAAPTSIPVSEPPADDAPADNAPADDATTTEAPSDTTGTDKIENFVAGATEEATPPAADSPAPTPEPAPAATPAADDTSAETPAQEQPVVTAVADAPAPTPPATDTSDDDAKASDDKLVADAAQALIDSTESKEAKDESKPDKEAVDDSAPVAHKKVIKPLDDEGPKKDINSLLAAEAAKEAEGQKPAAGSTVAPNNPADPGSIAL